ncbi:MAG: phage minor capsid protein [Terrisporobacter othiniensis]|nr:phage minor capsid protein [Terrisporobacter othiniensis]MDU6984247.1 phage minor capsid protein [Terrisporobacter othiniensis]
MSSKYDIRAIFEKMELDLISSMHRNLKYHESEEDKEGFQWEQWQRSKLRALNKYRQENKLIMDNRIGSIEEDVNRELESNYNKGLNRISNVINKLKSLFIKNKSKNNVQDFKNHTKKISPNVVKNLSIEFPEDISEKGYINEPKENQFFSMNDKKLKALQESVNNDIKKANATVLRKMDDVYRKTIYKTHVYLQSGAVSLNQAIDMATKDFLNTGINSITYKDGKHVNIASYVEMCLRTASHRATLLGEGKKRDEYGIYTVVVSAHANTCPMCAVWQGKVLIDDVFSNPTEEYLQENKGKYKLLSEAIDAGLLHVNCRHTLTTYFPDITNLPTVPDERKALERYKAEQEQRRLERYIRKWKRISIGSQDEANIEFASNKLLEYSSQLKTHLEKHPYLRRNRQKEKIYGIKQTGGKYTKGDIEWMLRRESEADTYYEKVRLDNSDIEKISKNTGFSMKKIDTIKNHVFNNKHIRFDGTLGLLDADYDMAVAWQRLINGNYEDRDILLLKHEYLESGLEKRYNLTNKDAHDITTKKYDWYGYLLKEKGEFGEDDCLNEITR